MLDVNIIDKMMIGMRGIPGYQQMETMNKGINAGMTLKVFGAAFEAVTGHVKEAQTELATWEDGRRIGMGVLPNGPYATLEKRGKKLVYLCHGLKEPDVAFLFKNADAATMTFSTYLGFIQAYNERRIIMRGDPGKAMEFVRVLEILLKYLLPRIILNRVNRRPLKFKFSEYMTAFMVNLALGPKLLKVMFK